jgi:serine/threonine protein kinase
MLGKTIGEGTFGKVKVGTHILTGERVAIKILEKSRIKEVADIERVTREIAILKRIRHPNVIRLYEVIDASKQIFLIMEYLDGAWDGMNDSCILIYCFYCFQAVSCLTTLFVTNASVNRTPCDSFTTLLMGVTTCIRWTSSTAI